ncbi:hypothetical protein HNY73_019124 [Argiope bruennichi]|uniref:Calx-beta domain-containing protein n=1 Tax=Argiope bruennichi TaxID=94029 RepID=A0A8T0EFV0_ARGBR|nr:hypothetical protein HNY73_019124 [Argiope bruennichi]
MKPESIKFVLKTYLKERENALRYNHVTSYLSEPPEYMPDLLIMEPQAASLALDELNVPVEPQVEMLAVGIGRRLREIANGFDLNAAINQASGIGNRVQFKEHSIRVPSTCDCIQIPIVRTGALDGIVNVGWTTHDKSAKAGIHYVNSQGNISFAQSEEKKTIEVEMIEDREEKKDICFTVELFDARGTFNTVTVYIVDDSNLYAEEKYFIKNIFSCADNIPISEIVTRLVDNVVTPNTFKAALQCTHSTAYSCERFNKNIL